MHQFILRMLAIQFTVIAARDVIAADQPPPNFILVFVDNFGNGDLSCYGSRLHRTPNVDQLAREGTRFTSFYVASGVCTASRAALLTGCYPRRNNMHVSDKNTAVLQPLAKKGLNPDEVTIAEVLKTAGYTTTCIGKWHVGDQLPFLPTRQGFDEFFGIPYSDDMTKDKRPTEWPDLPLMRNESIIEAPVDRNSLIRRCTIEAVEFIRRNRDRPFFLYLPHTMPGSTSHPFSSAEFQGRSRNGAYGDAVEELDWSTGEILRTVHELGLDNNTVIVWTSDNGAVKRQPQQGSNEPYRGFAYDTSEGAMRMPCLMRWPHRIPTGNLCDQLCTAMDFLPTFAALAGAELPADRKIDGHDIRPILFQGPAASSPWNETGFCYYRMEQLQAIRVDCWKLYLPLEKKLNTLNRRTAPSPLELFDVCKDPGETKEVSRQHPNVVQRLLKLAEQARHDLGDGEQIGRGQRPAGWVN